MPYLWTPRLREDFHQALETLYAETKIPCAEAAYCEPLTEEGSKNYTLRLRDELQLANHIAFLAHSQEGVEAISGACVEDVGDGLVIRLASNHTPSQGTVSQLRRILSTMSRGATQGTSRVTLQESIFADVLNLSQERILQRIRPRWIPTPSYFHGSEEPLLNRIIQNNRFQSRSGLTTYLISRLDGLLSDLRLLETPERPDEQSVRASVKAIVCRCANVSYSGEHRSLEQQLRQIPGCQRISESREVAQIDKLARYLGLSKDLVKLARRFEYRHVIRNVVLEYLTAYPASKPGGALRTCHVHAEVQLILHYEQHSLEKRPRAIGCSKSACFLCESLINMVGQYHISYAHRRLYNQWTIPDVSWMTTERAHCFRSILENMITEMVSLTRNMRTTAHSRIQIFRPFGLESRAGLLLSSGSDFNASTVPSRLTSPLPVSHVSTPLLQDMETGSQIPSVHSIKVGSTFSLSSVDLRRDDLPHQRSLNSNTGSLYFQLDGLFLIIDCSSISAGRLSICEVEEVACGQKQGVRCIQVSDIPTTGMTLRDATSSSTLKFWLLVARSIAIEIEIYWQAQHVVDQKRSPV